MAEPIQRAGQGPTGEELERLEQVPKVRQELALYNLLLYCAHKLAEQYGGREEEEVFAEMIADAEDAGIKTSHPKIPKGKKKG